MTTESEENVYTRIANAEQDLKNRGYREIDRIYLDSLANYYRQNVVIQICSRLAKASVLRGGMHILGSDSGTSAKPSDEHRFLLGKWQTFYHDVLDHFWIYGFTLFELMTDEAYENIVFPQVLKMDHVRIFVKFTLKGEMKTHYLPRVDNESYRTLNLVPRGGKESGGEESDDEEEIEIPLKDVHAYVLREPYKTSASGVLRCQSIADIVQKDKTLVEELLEIYVAAEKRRANPQTIIEHSEDKGGPNMSRITLNNGQPEASRETGEDPAVQALIELVRLQNQGKVDPSAFEHEVKRMKEEAVSNSLLYLPPKYRVAKGVARAEPPVHIMQFVQTFENRTSALFGIRRSLWSDLGSEGGRSSGSGSGSIGTSGYSSAMFFLRSTSQEWKAHLFNLFEFVRKFTEGSSMTDQVTSVDSIALPGIFGMYELEEMLHNGIITPEIFRTLLSQNIGLPKEWIDGELKQEEDGPGDGGGSQKRKGSDHSHANGRQKRPKRHDQSAVDAARTTGTV